VIQKRKERDWLHVEDLRRSVPTNEDVGKRRKESGERASFYWVVEK